MKDRLTRDDCIALLVKSRMNLIKSAKPFAQAFGFFRQRNYGRKILFGPFPRALEAAGIKEKRRMPSKSAGRKRLRAKKNRLKYKLEKVKNCESRNIKEK